MSSWGTEAPYSLAEIDGQIFSYDREGIRIYNGSYPVLSSFYIQDLIDGMSNSSANLERRFGLAYKDRYFLNAGNITDEDGKTISNAMIVYDYLKNMFTIYSFADVMTAGTKVIDKNGDEIVIFGDSSGQCYKMFTGDVDDDTNIEMKLESHIFYPQGIETEIEPSEIYIASENPSRMELSISGDFGEIIPQCQIEDYAQTIKINGVGHCRGVKIFITHAKKGRPIFNGFSLNYTLGER
jgi:general stress protein 26